MVWGGGGLFRSNNPEMSANANKRPRDGDEIEEAEQQQQRIKQKLVCLKYDLAQSRHEIDDLENRLYVAVCGVKFRKRIADKNEPQERAKMSYAALVLLGGFCRAGPALSRIEVKAMLNQIMDFGTPSCAELYFNNALYAGTLAIVHEFVVANVGLPRDWRHGSVPPPMELVLRQLVLLECGERRDMLDQYMQAKDPALALCAFHAIVSVAPNVDPKHHASILIDCAVRGSKTGSPVGLLSPDVIEHIALLVAANNAGFYF